MAGVFERSEFPAITDFAGQAAARIRLKAMSLADSQSNRHNKPSSGSLQKQEWCGRNAAAAQSSQHSVSAEISRMVEEWYSGSFPALRWER